MSSMIYQTYLLFKNYKVINLINEKGYSSLFKFVFFLNNSTHMFVTSILNIRLAWMPQISRASDFKIQFNAILYSWITWRQSNLKYMCLGINCEVKWNERSYKSKIIENHLSHAVGF